MTDLTTLRDQLIALTNDPLTPIGVRNDAALLLDSSAHLLPRPTEIAPTPRPAPPTETWMSETAQPLVVEQQPAQAQLPLPAPVKRADMLPLPGWIADVSVNVERLARGILAGQDLLHALATTMQGVQRGHALTDQLHAECEALVKWYVALAEQVKPA